jgi:hypothetical protein
VPFDIAPMELSERRVGCEVERRSHFDSCSFTRRFTYVLLLSGQFRYVVIQASLDKLVWDIVGNAPLLNKPFQPGELSAAVRSNLDARYAPARRRQLSERMLPG